MKTKIKLTSKFKNHEELVKRLNMIEGKTWTAKVNKFIENKTISEINNLSGRKS